MMQRTMPNRQLEDVLRAAHPSVIVVAGVDEAGMGALAGPLVVVVLYPDTYEFPSWMADSKCLTRRQREEVCRGLLVSTAVWGVGWATHEEIDGLGLYAARDLALGRALGLDLRQPIFTPPFGLILDGERWHPPSEIPTLQAPKADERSLCVAAASVIAKVSRDTMMREYHLAYLDYGFNTNKGYPTQRHLAALREMGPSPIHRRTYRPVADIISLEV